MNAPMRMDEIVALLETAFEEPDGCHYALDALLFAMQIEPKQEACGLDAYFEFLAARMHLQNGLLDHDEGAAWHTDMADGLDGILNDPASKIARALGHFLRYREFLANYREFN